MTQPTITITPLKRNAPGDTAAEIMAVIRISCPPLDAEAAPGRSRLNLGLAIDRSSSMDKLPIAEAKACAERVILSLHPGDRVSVTAYSDRAVTIVPATVISECNSAEITAAIRRIEAAGFTNLHGGWLDAATQVAPGLATDVLTRVILLSDGQANRGLTGIGEIVEQAAKLAETGISTSTIGLGRNFNEALMAALAEAGQGQASYGETADDLWPSFEAEFGLMSSTCGKSVRLRLESTCGGSITVETGLRTDAAGQWILPNLVHGAETAVLVRVNVTGLAGEHAHVLRASVSHDRMDGGQAPVLAASLDLPVVDFAAFVTGPSDPGVAERIKDNEAARLQDEARAASARMDFGTVGTIADKLAAMADGNAWIGGIAQTVSGLARAGDANMLAKELTYASIAFRTRYDSSAPIPVGAEPAFLKKRTSQGRAV